VTVAETLQTKWGF